MHGIEIIPAVKESRSDLLQWVNHSLPPYGPNGQHVPVVTKVEQCGNGLPYVLMLTNMLPIPYLPLQNPTRVKVPAAHEFDAVCNLKLFQEALRRNGITPPFELANNSEKLIKGNFQTNLALLQWFRGLHNALDARGITPGVARRSSHGTPETTSSKREGSLVANRRLTSSTCTGDGRVPSTAAPIRKANTPELSRNTNTSGNGGNSGTTLTDDSVFLTSASQAATPTPNVFAVTKAVPNSLEMARPAAAAVRPITSNGPAGGSSSVQATASVTAAATRAPPAASEPTRPSPTEASPKVTPAKSRKQRRLRSTTPSAGGVRSTSVGVRGGACQTAPVGHTRPATGPPHLSLGASPGKTPLPNGGIRGMGTVRYQHSSTPRGGKTPTRSRPSKVGASSSAPRRLPSPSPQRPSSVRRHRGNSILSAVKGCGASADTCVMAATTPQQVEAPPPSTPHLNLAARETQTVATDSASTVCLATPGPSAHEDIVMLERQFYYDKLRCIEKMVSSVAANSVAGSGITAGALARSIREILYATH